MKPGSMAKAMGAKGGAARAAALSPEQRSAIAHKAARARWQTVKRNRSHPPAS